jgi:aryl-alcohol dehydrogenase-like predicted oxidoreductase
MEAEIIPMCEDQGMAIVPWAALGGGQLLTAEQREQRKNDPDARQGYGESEKDLKVSAALEDIAKTKGTTLQAVVSAYGTFSANKSLTTTGPRILDAPIHLRIPHSRCPDTRTCPSNARGSAH